jgi:uncharacterized membrane-anchored protein
MIPEAAQIVRERKQARIEARAAASARGRGAASLFFEAANESRCGDKGRADWLRARAIEALGVSP